MGGGRDVIHALAASRSWFGSSPPSGLVGCDIPLWFSIAGIIFIQTNTCQRAGWRACVAKYGAAGHDVRAPAWSRTTRMAYGGRLVEWQVGKC
jgi:hypothetical protein